MRKHSATAVWSVFFASCLWAAPPQQAHNPIPSAPPAWAYPVSPPEDRAPSSDTGVHHVPGSSKALTRAEILDYFNIPDWHPDRHPSMPSIVEHGRKPAVRACGYCHLPNGEGRPENASLAGLPAQYIEEQVREFQTGARKSSEPKMLPPTLMLAVAANVTDDEVRAAAEYFASLQRKPWIRVVETDEVPKTEVSGSMFVPVAGGGSEAIGNRIVEVPESVEQTRLRDDESGFVAYVPKGSIRRGQILVMTGGSGLSVQCSICHGANLNGIGPVPSLRGRSPSYIFRQLYDIQHGNRNGLWTGLMKAPVEHLTQEDMVSIAAYLATLKP